MMWEVALLIPDDMSWPMVSASIKTLEKVGFKIRGYRKIESTTAIR